MSEQLEINGIPYVPVAQAAKQFGYTSDYLTKLAREKKISGSKIHRRWFVSVESIEEFLAHHENTNIKKSKELRTERKRLFAAAQTVRRSSDHMRRDLVDRKVHAAAQAAVVLVLGLSVGAGGHAVARDQAALLSSSGSGLQALEQMAVRFYEFITVRRSVEEVRTVTHVVSQDEMQVEQQPSMADDTYGIYIDTHENKAQVRESAERIANSFSDDINVILDEHSSDQGVIVPQFKDGETGDPYAFVVVPIPNTSTQ